MNHIIKLLPLFAILVFTQISFAQCPTGAFFTANKNCANLTWTENPNPYPATVLVDEAPAGGAITYYWNGTYYSMDGNPCGGNPQFNKGFTGTITIGTTECIYTDGSFTTLPLDILSFRAERIKNQLLITWETGIGDKNRSLTLERSSDQQYWQNLGEGDQYHTTETGLFRYQFLDKTPGSGTNFYRLAIIDQDGQKNYSELVSFTLGTENKIQVFPNPATDLVHLSMDGNDPLFRVELIGPFGTILTAFSGDIGQINLQSYPRGLYYLRFFHPSGIITQHRMILSR